MKKKYNWKRIQTYYDKGNSLRDCIKKYGMAKRSIEDAIRRGDLNTRSNLSPLERYITANKRPARSYVKKIVLKENLLQYKCQICYIDSWMGQPLSLHLDHKSGDRWDNHLENLRFLCPNCHSQTPTFAGKNRGKK